MGGLGGRKKYWYDSKYPLIVFNLHEETISLIYKLCQVIEKKVTSSHDFFKVLQIFYKYQTKIYKIEVAIQAYLNVFISHLIPLYHFYV